MTEKKRILKAYDERYLTPLIGKGEIRDKLYAGLEETLTQELNAEVLELQSRVKEEILSQKIKFDRIKSPYGAKAENILAHQKISTYGELIDYMREHGPIALLRLRGMGPVTITYLKKHLSNRGLEFPQQKSFRD